MASPGRATITAGGDGGDSGSSAWEGFGDAAFAKIAEYHALNDAAPPEPLMTADEIADELRLTNPHHVVFPNMGCSLTAPRGAPKRRLRHHQDGDLENDGMDNQQEQDGDDDGDDDDDDDDAEALTGDMAELDDLLFFAGPQIMPPPADGLLSRVASTEHDFNNDNNNSSSNSSNDNDNGGSSGSSSSGSDGSDEGGR